MLNLLLIPQIKKKKNKTKLLITTKRAILLTQGKDARNAKILFRVTRRSLMPLKEVRNLLSLFEKVLVPCRASISSSSTKPGVGKYPKQNT